MSKFILYGNGIDAIWYSLCPLFPQVYLWHGLVQNNLIISSTRLLSLIEVLIIQLYIRQQKVQFKYSASKQLVQMETICFHRKRIGNDIYMKRVQ